MRDALSAALQDFAGAMIIVSHDRHLLRTTADDFYLVDKGMVSEFSGDLDDYHKYLIEQRKQELSQSASERREQRIQEKQAASGKHADFLEGEEGAAAEAQSRGKASPEER